MTDEAQPQDVPPTAPEATTQDNDSPEVVAAEQSPGDSNVEPTPTVEASAARAPDPEAAASETPVPAVASPESAPPAAQPVVQTETPHPTTEEPTADANSERSSDRLREKMGAKSADRAVGSEDILTQRRDTPTNIEPVDIPGKDALDADLEAEISSALGGELAAPAPPAAEPSEVSGEGAEGSATAEAEELGPGSRITGAVQHIHGDDVFLTSGQRADVVVSLKQFPENKPPVVGDSVTVVIDSIDEDGLFRSRLPQAKVKTGGNWDGLAVGQVVDCLVTGTNKGGLQVTVSNLKGFLPASQVDLGFVSEMEQYVGQTLSVQITEVKPKKKNLVVSRRVLLQAEREAQQAGFWETLEVGQDLPGTVKTIKNYGAFVNLGPIDGFLHVGEISWSRINHPNEALKEGQEIQVRILKIDKEKGRISLGMKQMVQNPWMGLSDRYPSERVVSGKVTRIADFGAFVELEPGVEGLVHISQLAWRRVGSVNEVLKVGDEKEFQVLEVDQKRKRVSLSLKALEQKPESMKKAEAEEEARPPRKENPDLRGGTGSNKGGGLFGNPSDFSSSS